MGPRTVPMRVASGLGFGVSSALGCRVSSGLGFGISSGLGFRVSSGVFRFSCFGLSPQAL